MKPKQINLDGWILFWTNSKKYKQFKKELEKKKEQFLKLEFSLDKIMKTKRIILTRESLEDTLDKILAFSLLTPEEKEEYEWINEEYTTKVEKTQLYFDLTRNLVNWYFYMKLYLEKEDFEMATKLRDVIEIEIKEFKSSLDKYCNDIEPDEDETINYTNESIKKLFEL